MLPKRGLDSPVYLSSFRSSVPFLYFFFLLRSRILVSEKSYRLNLLVLSICQMLERDFCLGICVSHDCFSDRHL